MTQVGSQAFEPVSISVTVTCEGLTFVRPGGTMPNLSHRRGRLPRAWARGAWLTAPPPPPAQCRQQGTRVGKLGTLVFVEPVRALHLPCIDLEGLGRQHHSWRVFLRLDNTLENASCSHTRSCSCAHVVATKAHRWCRCEKPTTVNLAGRCSRSRTRGLRQRGMQMNASACLVLQAHQNELTRTRLASHLSHLLRLVKVDARQTPGSPGAFVTKNLHGSM